MHFMTVTIDFSCYDSARAFASAWAHFSLRGYTISAENAQGGASVTLDNVTESEKSWIDTIVTEMTK